jgi:hypothetical protein
MTLGQNAVVRILAAGSAFWLLMVAMNHYAFAGSCARPDETLALRAAAIQQKLMVAALYCHDVGRYNRFVMSYRKELQEADAELMRYFRRSGGGEAAYHAYKTRLANAYSMSGIREQEEFCEGARVVFATARGGDSLHRLVFALPDARIAERNDCPQVYEANMGGSSLVRGKRR